MGAVSNTTPHQAELFELDQVEGYAALARRERLFAEGIFRGLTQREAAKQAGVGGDDTVVDATASRLLRSVKVQRVLNQAWVRSGASIDTTLRQAAEIAMRAFNEWQNGNTAERREAARKEWQAAAAFIVQVHAKLQVEVKGGINVSVISDDDRRHLMELEAAGVPVRMPELGGRN